VIRARRVAAVLGVAALVAAGCVVAGIWQWGRHEDRSAAAARVTANYDAAPVPVADVLTDGRSLADDDAWRPVAVVGRYLDDGGVLLRGRPVDGQPAVHELALLELIEGPLAGSVLVVNRGWAALAPEAGVPRLDPPPSGTVEVVARLRPLESPSGTSAPAGQVRAIAVGQVLAASGAEPAGPLLPAYGVVLSEDGRAPAGLQPLPRPEFRLGVNLSYAFQWWLFALGALVGGVVLLRGDAARAEAARTAGETAGPADDAERAPRPVRRRRPTAEDEEDALIDAQDAR
jgi:cytochrome oxidase assembly protein ShyY1